MQFLRPLFARRRHRRTAAGGCALADYDKALTLPLTRAKRALIQGCRASIFEFWGQRDQARQTLRLLVQLEPSSIKFWLRLAKFLARENNNAEAAEAARRILAPKPGHQQAPALLDGLTN